MSNDRNVARSRSAAIRVVLPDGSMRELEANATGADLAGAIGPRLAKAALAVRVNGRVRDLSAPLPDGAEVAILTFDDPQGREVFWHSSAHVMAQAVQELYPGTKLAIGPPIEEGFYYDFDRPTPFSPEDLAAIEARMADIVAGDHRFSGCEMSIDQARKRLADEKEPYKLEILADLPAGEPITFYSHDSFTDLCRGPHIPSTGRIKAYKLLTSAGAYWRGDSDKPMLQRIYGVSYPDRKLLDDYLHRLEEAKKRDHRKLGKELDLFSIHEESGPGLVFWHPRGARVRGIIEDYWRSRHRTGGYDLVYSPHIAKTALWDISGHRDFYRDSMFGEMEVDKGAYQLKPMNCPFHILMYQSSMRSYRDLPIRWAELGTVYRYELPGVLHGLMRVRGFTQDDAHIFCTPEQLEDEISGVLKFTLSVLRDFGFDDFAVCLSTRPEKAIGEAAEWSRAEAALERALKLEGLTYRVDEGGGAFYGPKIDVQVKDVMGRAWQCSTIQFDFNLPQRFDLEFVDSDGTRRRPYMVHRALLGSLERFFGILIEHYAGAFPVWLAPVQLAVIPITDSQLDYARQVAARASEAGLRAWVNEQNEKLGAKIRLAETQKVPAMFVVGAREAETGTVAVRRHGQGDQGTLQLDEAITALVTEDRRRDLQAPNIKE
jgi:threonyl-tRNA synthetase